MECKICKEDYSEIFTKDFKKGICLPCQCEISFNELSGKWEKELVIFNDRLKTYYDFDTFCFDIWGKEDRVKQGLGKDTPELNKVFKTEVDMKKEYEKPHDLQLDLFSLPF